MRRKSEWLWGDKTLLARAAGISPSYLSDILSGRKACSATLATRLEKEARALGYEIQKVEWVFVQLRSKNPLFG